MRTLIFDTETTDLLGPRALPLKRQPHVIELFGLVQDGAGVEAETFNSLFDPGFKIVKKTTEITGITPEMLDGQPFFKNKASDIVALIESCDEVVAHNLSFDKGMIDNELRRCGLAVKWPALICTVEQSEHYKGFRLNLASLHEHLLGCTFAGAHRAENDVRALAACFNEMRRRGDV